MSAPYRDDDAVAVRLERGWFAAERAIGEAKASCELLSHVMEQARAEWVRARIRLADLEALRDGFHDELSAMDSVEAHGPAAGAARHRSAA